MLLYLVTATGFALNLHYCGSIITSVNIDSPAKKCSTFAMSCCRDKHVEVKVKDAHQGQSISFSGKLFAVDLPVVKPAGYALSAPEVASAVIVDRGPPGVLGRTPLYIRNRVFRI